MLPAFPSQFLINAANKGCSIPPLDAKRFNGSYGHFCTTKRLVLDRELQLHGRKVSLPSFHEEAMKQRGYDIHEVGCCPLRLREGIWEQSAWYSGPPKTYRSRIQRLRRVSEIRRVLHLGAFTVGEQSRCSENVEYLLDLKVINTVVPSQCESK